MTWKPMALAIETERLSLRLRDERDAVLEKIGFRRDHVATDDRGEVVYLVLDL